MFDGEQAAKSMDSSSNEADETIRYLYRLDELDEILAANQRILTEIQNAEGKRGTSSSLSNLRTRQSDIDAIRAKLRTRCEKLREEIAAFEAEKVEKEKQRQELDKSYEKLNQEKNDILKEQQKNRGEIDVKITSILGIIKSPYLLSESLCARMFELGNSMKKLKLPKTIAKDFFTELASADRCVCDRCIGERERTAILKRADQYLGSDQQSVLNMVKSSLMNSVYDERLKKAFEELEELRAQANRLDTRFKTNEEKLIKAGGEKARELQERIEELIRLISIARDELERIESKDENDASLTEENNLHKADQKFKYYEQEIAKATRTNTALRKKELVDSLVNEIKLQATTALKQEIVRKTNEKLRRVIVDDYVEIESIDRYIKLKGRDGASEGQTLSIAYCFLGTLFEDSELEFPFIIDSPTGKMDFEKRQAVADIIPLVFNQMIAFVQSAEVERFADRFYANPDSQYLTVVASPQDQAVVVYEGIDFFDSYQREHKGDEIAKSAQSYFNNIMNLEGSHAAEDKNKFIQFDVYYCCALIGMAAGQIDEDTSELKDLVERYPVQYRDCKAQIAGLLVVSEARRLGIDTQSPKLEQIMLQYISNNDTLLSEDGIKTLNAYALKGYRLITDYPLFDKPTSREEFLDAFNVAMQFYEKKDS